MSDEVDQETIGRDKLLLDLMIHYYDEDERRNELIDSKNSQMIVLSGAMLTLQSTLVTKLLVDTFLNENIHIACCCKLILSGLMILSIIGYFLSMYFFIKAYTFKENYEMVPDPDSVLECKEEDYTKYKVIEEMLETLNSSINSNDKIINKKVETGKKGFCILKISGVITLIFLILFILITLFSI